VVAGPIRTSDYGIDTPFFFRLMRGQIPHHKTILRSGRNPDVDVGAQESLWPQGGLYMFPPAASVMTASSSSANDAAAGTGARTLLVSGLDANYDEIQEVVALNGQTPVNTVNTFLRIWTLAILSAGSGETQAGTIYIGTGAVVAGVPANIYNLCEIGFNNSQAIQWTVPRDYTAFLVQVNASTSQSATNQFTELSLRSRSLGGVFFRGSNIVIGGQSVDFEVPVPRMFAEKTDIDAMAVTSDVNILCTGILRYVYIKNFY